MPAVWRNTPTTPMLLNVGGAAQYVNNAPSPQLRKQKSSKRLSYCSLNFTGSV